MADHLLPRPRPGAGQTYTRIPSVVVEDLHVVYRVQGPASTAGSPVAALKRILSGSSSGPVREVHAVRGVSFAAYEGDAIGVIGSNGSGKSTLLRAIAGLLPPARGAVYTKRQPSLLGVNAVLLNDLSGERNVVLGCLAMGMSRAEVDEKFNSIVELSGLEKSIHLPMKSYSSGMASRLRFAIAASVDPEILLVDEALNTGDAQFADRSKLRMDELREQAGCVFLVSHSLDTIKDMCTRVIWLDKGDLIMDGDPEAAIKAYQEFTRHLSKGNNISATRILDEAKANLVATEVRGRSSRRSRG